MAESVHEVAGAVRRAPDVVQIQHDPSGPWQDAIRTPDGWGCGDALVTLDDGGSVALVSDGAVARIWLRWAVPVPSGVRVLGDHWERGYGDLEWRGPAADRPLPWYFLLQHDEATVGIGVRTGPGAWCAWSVDAGGIGLLLDVRAGAAALRPGDRVVALAELVSVTGADPFPTALQLCRQMCADPVLPPEPVYGGNNWYHAYGRSSASAILGEARQLADLAGDHPNRPWMVVDDGWQSGWAPGFNGGPWRSGNDRFPDMSALATDIAAAGARPGIWFRPLLTASAGDLPTLRETAGGTVPDPSVPETVDLVTADVHRLVDQGYRLIKHDFTTVDVTGRWGRDMGWDPVDPELRFADPTRTTVEILRDLYRAIAGAAGPALVLGCNTVGHLAAGLFALQRTGDDTSGVDWARTRTLGVNTLAFRMPQHGTFFATDADCVGITDRIDWHENRQWLDLLARSGTALFVSAAPGSLTAEQESDLRTAFATAAGPRPPARPLDWTDTAVPSEWAFGDAPAGYDWFAGAARPLLGG
ncbi:hypothetical protein GIS00_24985 [Nakamurella sp. YIM 132087]|uniref:Alpha-galactosidase n=1 Tax=Nakamurella alba TaxID=2665158 RepID=A0A7K1FWJ7_9ACTN|nr:hypothetical protein [Nakamurella alba]MTD17194.1 hypothetical protein [Nakamurella alba]